MAKKRSMFSEDDEIEEQLGVVTPEEQVVGVVPAGSASPGQTPPSVLQNQPTPAEEE